MGGGGVTDNYDLPDAREKISFMSDQILTSTLSRSKKD